MSKKPNYTQPFSQEIEVGDKKIKIEVGRFSEQTSAAVLVTCGETVVHTTIALGRQVDLGYFPMSVEFAEKLYAGGIIKGSRWVKRDGRPTDEAVLKARVIDRTMRPLFPEGVKHELQIVNTVFSYDSENDPDMLGLLATGVGLSISEIPFAGPVTGLRIGYSKADQKFMINPTLSERKEADLDLIVSGGKDSIVMVEAGANEVSEDVLVEALTKAQDEINKICQQIDQIVAAIGKDKVELVTVDEEAEAVKAQVAKVINKKFAAEIETAVVKKAHLEDPQLDELIAKVQAELAPAAESDEEEISQKVISGVIYDLMKTQARQMILDGKSRPDGRKSDEIRPIWCEVDVFPRTHGSAMFKRGATQAVTVTTLGSPSLSQHIEDMDGEEIKRYMHYYNMPPYASGEAGRFGYPKRREIGHGALAERALLPMIPDVEEFPYAIHVVSEILSSNGSTSQASVCGSTMSLMAAGVPIKRPVAGIAMGMISDGQKQVILSDIQGLEDHVGDMDFKVAGTKDGVTALQMDIKLTGLNREILVQALDQAKAGRLHILEKMLACIKEPRPQLSHYAPKIKQITIDGERIGELIGPGGKVIKDIIQKSGAEVDVEEDKDKGVGLVYITSPDQEKIDAAAKMVDDLLRVVEVDDEFTGTVTRIENYGAFVEFLPGREGLVHVSAMSTEYVEDPNQLVKLGDQVQVRVAEIKDDGKIGLSMISKEDAEKMRSGGNTRGGSGQRPYRERSDRGGERDRGGRDRGRRQFGSNRGYSRDNGGRRDERPRRSDRPGHRSNSGFKSMI